MDKQNLQKLTTQIEEVLQTCHQLVEENQLLREEQATLLAERDSLLEKNALARNRIEGMISRLKAMEMTYGLD